MSVGASWKRFITGPHSDGLELFDACRMRVLP
jgi:hypothetical protein